MANQTLNNLKNIHEIQKDGALLEMLRSVRGFRGDIDAFGKKMNDQKASFVKPEVVAEKPQEIKAAPAQQVKEVENKTTPAFAETLNSTIKKFDETAKEAPKVIENNNTAEKNVSQIQNYNNQNTQQGGYQNRPYNNNNQNGQQQGGYQNRTYNNTQGEQRPQGGYQNRGYNNQNGQQGGYQNRYNNQAGQQGQQSQGGYQNRPYNNQNGQQGGYQNRFNNQAGQQGQQGQGGYQNRPYNNQNGQQGGYQNRYNNQAGQQSQQGQGGYQNRPYNNPNGQQGGYQNRYNNGQNGQQGQGGYQNRYNNGQGQQGQGGYQNRYNNGPQAQNGPRKFGTNNFVSTKVNNFRSFDVVEPLEVKQERNFSNKNKSKSHDDDRNGNRKLNDLSKFSGVLIEDENGIEEVAYGSRKSGYKKRREVETIIAPAIKNATITSKEITIKVLSEKIGKPVTEIVKKLMLLGVMATINSTIDFDTAELIANELGITLELKLTQTQEEKLFEAVKAEDTEEQLVKRPPIVAVMGHVDHGKTSLLDAFRQTNVVAGEAGGITQKIGAYQINFNSEKITFIDTPGHAAFTAMRARGAKATDIAILIVAADDGIMPQTIEAINHIKAANVPMIVAINKMDKPDANPDRIKQQLTEHGVLPEEWGGDTICVPVSAKTGIGLDKLKENILLVAEVQELKANPDKMASGVVIEAELDKNRGPVASIIVQNGTLHVGDAIMSGLTYGKVRAMYNEHGKAIKVAPPSTPVAILGFNEVPISGDMVVAVEESISKQVIQERVNKIKTERSKETSGVTLDNFMNKVHEGTLKNLNIIIKADTIGSVEALKATLLAIRNEEAKVNIIHSGAGAVTESDVILGQTTGSIIICFNQKPVAKAKSLADNLKIEIKEYNIIYQIVDDITSAISGMLTVKYEEKYIGRAEIRMVFKLSTAGKVAGSYMTDGKATRNCIVKVMRDGTEIGSSTIESLKIIKDEKPEVTKGYECGIKLRDNLDFAQNDLLEFYVKEAIKRG